MYQLNSRGLLHYAKGSYAMGLLSNIASFPVCPPDCNEPAGQGREPARARPQFHYEWPRTTGLNRFQAVLGGRDL